LHEAADDDVEGNSVRRTTKRKAARRKTVKRKTARRKTARKKPATRKGAKLWSPAEVKALRQMYKGTPTPEIAKKMRRTVSSVRSKAVALGLKKAAMRKKKAAKRKVAKRKARRR
jgi:DNA-binding NarL/FixJ family response regulator